jgi:hypothetical protein
MLPVKLLSALLCTCLSAQITAAAAVPVTSVGAVLLTHERDSWFSAERVAVAFETELVLMAETFRPAGLLVAARDRAPTTPGHVGTGSLYDLSNPLSR